MCLPILGSGVERLAGDCHAAGDGAVGVATYVGG
jgi:hypothetical protein